MKSRLVALILILFLCLLLVLLAASEAGPQKQRRVRYSKAEEARMLTLPHDICGSLAREAKNAERSAAKTRPI